jgi:hypothetical protein
MQPKWNLVKGVWRRGPLRVSQCIFTSFWWFDVVTPRVLNGRLGSVLYRKTPEAAKRAADRWAARIVKQLTGR